MVRDVILYNFTLVNKGSIGTIGVDLNLPGYKNYGMPKVTFLSGFCILSSCSYSTLVEGILIFLLVSLECKIQQNFISQYFFLIIFINIIMSK